MEQDQSEKRSDERRRAIVWSVALIIAIMAAASWLFHFPYIYTLIGLVVWAAFGHLLTIDDDEPGGWSNPDGDKTIWRTSMRHLLWKFCLLIGLIVLVVTFPALNRLGAG